MTTWNGRLSNKGNLLISKEVINVELHYGNMQTDVDKIIHLLSAARQNGIYGKALVECVREFGEEITQEAIAIFKTEYETVYNRYQ